MEDVLTTKYHYYIKGGKAFNFYFPTQSVPTGDYDIVVTLDTAHEIIDDLMHVAYGRSVTFDSESASESVSESTSESNSESVSESTSESASETIRIVETIASVSRYEQIYPEKQTDGSYIHVHVMSVSFNDHIVLDMIIESEEHTIQFGNFTEACHSVLGILRYMKWDEFQKDVRLTYLDRKRKYARKSWNKFAHKRMKLEKSKKRYDILEQSKPKPAHTRMTSASAHTKQHRMTSASAHTKQHGQGKNKGRSRKA